MATIRCATAPRVRRRWLRIEPAVAGWTLACVLLLIVSPAAAQPGATQHPEPPAASPAPVDPLGRETPLGTITGFTSAVHREDFVAAAAFMQLTPEQDADAPDLARDLSALLDRYFTDPIKALSSSPSGTLGDGLPLDRDRLPLTINGVTVDIFLVRVTDPQHGPVWLIASESIAEVPGLRSSLEATWIERVMPRPLVTHGVFGLSLAQWLAWLVMILGPLILFRLAAGLMLRIVRRNVTEQSRADVNAWFAGLAWPSVVVLTLLAHLVGLRFLAFSLTFRLNYVRVALLCLSLAIAWLLWRLMALSFAHAQIVAGRRGQSGTRSLILLGLRVVKVVIVLVTIFMLLSIAGVDTTTALAGVGIGGVALALGAQRTVENFLGGVFLLSDRALAVGDFCNISDRVGWIEDITLRSVRLRTLEQTLLSIPAGNLAQGNIENFATRRKILLQSTLRLRYGTTAGQIQSILDGVRGLLAQHPQVETGTSRVRLTNFAANAVELEMFAYVQTAEMTVFLAVRERLLLAAAAIVESAGSGFARPTDFLYLNRRPADGESAAPAGPYASTSPDDRVT
jgi:MscS family membrane protein